MNTIKRFIWFTKTSIKYMRGYSFIYMATRFPRAWIEFNALSKKH